MSMTDTRWPSAFAKVETSLRRSQTCINMHNCTVHLESVLFTQDSVSGRYAHGQVAGWSIYWAAMLLRHGVISLDDTRHLVLHVYLDNNSRLWTLNNRTLAALKLAFRGSPGKRVPAVLHRAGEDRDREFSLKLTTGSNGGCVDVRKHYSSWSQCAVPNCSASRRGVSCEFHCCAACCLGCANHPRRVIQRDMTALGTPEVECTTPEVIARQSASQMPLANTLEPAGKRAESLVHAGAPAKSEPQVQLRDRSRAHYATNTALDPHSASAGWRSTRWCVVM